MLHIFKNDNGKFDFASVRTGNYIDGSSQGYNRVKSIYSVIQSKLKHDFNSKGCLVQDDTDLKNIKLLWIPVVGEVEVVDFVGNEKPYIPNQN